MELEFINYFADASANSIAIDHSALAGIAIGGFLKKAFKFATKPATLVGGIAGGVADSAGLLDIFKSPSVPSLTDPSRDQGVQSRVEAEQRKKLASRQGSAATTLFERDEDDEDIVRRRTLGGF